MKRVSFSKPKISVPEIRFVFFNRRPVRKKLYFSTIYLPLTMNELGKISLAFLTAALLLTGCRDDDEDPVTAEYTTLIYMAADNSLDSEVSYTLAQLKEGALKSKGTPVVYLDRQNENPRLFKISSNGEEILLKSYEEENSADASTLHRVINETKKLVPSGQFGLVMWSHSMGWVPSGYSKETRTTSFKVNRNFPRTRYVCTDNDTGDETGQTAAMEILDMAEEIPAATAEYILFDVCLMGSVEALYELRHTCNYMIASPTEVLAEAGQDASGMPYDEVLPLLFGGKEELLKVCQTYYNHYNGKEEDILRSATISLIDTQELDGLYNITAGILEGKLGQAEVMDVDEIQVYHTAGVPQVFFDLGDVIRELSTDVQYLSFEKQLNKTVIYKAATDKFINITINQDHFSGLSVYVPLSKWSANKEYDYYFSLGWSSVYY